jgi:UDP-N-acetyl-D-galactosamine dehydrogenase
VDPYYLLHKSKELGYNAQIITSGRRINDEMPAYIAKKLVQFMIQAGKNPGDTKVLVLGITFKENVADIRNSKIANLVRELMEYSINVHISDPHASPNEVAHEYRFSMIDQISNNYDAVIIAVNHDEYKELGMDYFRSIMNGSPILFDLKAIFDRPDEPNMVYWRL